jgi:pyruvate-formate lyase
MRDFTVKKGVMGYIVTIGCQVAGFSNKEDLLKAISEYVNDQEATENKYYKKCVIMNEVAVDPISPYGGTSDTFGTRLSNANANTTAFGQR